VLNKPRIVFARGKWHVSCNCRDVRGPIYANAETPHGAYEALMHQIEAIFRAKH